MSYFLTYRYSKINRKYLFELHIIILSNIIFTASIQFNSYQKNNTRYKIRLCYSKQKEKWRSVPYKNWHRGIIDRSAGMWLSTLEGDPRESFWLVEFIPRNTLIGCCFWHSDSRPHPMECDGRGVFLIASGWV